MMRREKEREREKRGGGIMEVEMQAIMKERMGIEEGGREREDEGVLTQGCEI